MRAAFLFLATALSAACAGADADPPPGESIAPLPEALFDSGSVDSQPVETMPGPRRARLDAAVRENAGCVACHADEAREWAGSRHRRSNTDAAYRAAFAREPSPFCRGCHAPEGDPTTEPPTAVSDLGVGCVTCHVTEAGTVLAAPGPASGAPHALRRSEAFARTGGCASCHEFRFPVGHGDDDGAHMQTTIREHERSQGAAKPCADCHMPLVGSRRSHDFSQVRDPAWLRANLRATAERMDDRTVRVTLAQPAPGHAFPTGDLFRRLEVGASSGAAREVVHLARHWETSAHGRTLARDDRVFDEPISIDLALPPGAGTATWWIRYQRVGVTGPREDPADVRVESEVLLHSGNLSPRPARAP